MEINTLYSWPKMSQEEFDHKCSIIRLIVEDYIRLNDWFSQFNELINQENQTLVVRYIYRVSSMNPFLFLYWGN